MNFAVEVRHDKLLTNHHFVEGSQVLQVGRLLGSVDYLRVLRVDLGEASSIGS